MKTDLKWVGAKDGRIWGLIQVHDYEIAWYNIPGNAWYSSYFTFWGYTKTKKLYFQNIKNTTVRDRSFGKSIMRKKAKYPQIQTPEMNAHVMCEFEQLMLLKKLKQGI